MQHQQFNEGLELGDLKRLVHAELHLDEFKSKLGRDEDVCVLSFKVTGKEPAKDLMNFCEKGYKWVLDSDVSTGEMDDGDYIVFVEAERTPDVPEQIMTLMADIMNLTGQKMSDWRLRYHSSKKDYEISEKSIASVMPISASSYKSKYGNKDIDKLKTSAGVKVTTKAPRNDYTESLKRAAGIV